MKKLKKGITPKELEIELTNCISDLGLEIGNNLYITGSNISTGKTEIFSAETTPETG